MSILTIILFLNHNKICDIRNLYNQNITFIYIYIYTHIIISLTMNYQNNNS